MWYNLAASQGLEAARHNRDLLAKRMMADQNAKAQELVRNWKAMPADVTVRHGDASDTDLYSLRIKS
jgi:hypothetical protein